MPTAPNAMATVSFSHVHMYVDRLQSVEEYKKLESKLNSFAAKASDSLEPSSTRLGADVAVGKATWEKLSKELGNPVTGETSVESWVGQKQDVVEQMLVGLGWRLTGSHTGTDTRSVVVTSSDSNGVKFVITAHNSKTMQEVGASEPSSKRAKADDGAPAHFFAAELARFANHQSSRQGIAVLGFQVAPGGLDSIYQNYKSLHPKMLHDSEPRQYPGAKVLEVYAYYKGDKGSSDADTGTLLRFIEVQDASKVYVLPGFQKVDASFDALTVPAYCDHWVSNVVSRTGFLDTLNETLGFTPKVDFNAGVVAAGEAQIESTVTGNDPNKLLTDSQMTLEDQSQVYLPTNNALSEVGHVHLYLKEIGQGVQHIASRVADLPRLVQRANDYRKMTGAGLAFLSIPRSYYGVLTAAWLAKQAGVELSEAEKHLEALQAAKLVDVAGVMDLEATAEKVAAALPAGTPAKVVEWVLRGRYSNMYALLGDHISEATYLKVVHNNILVDVQGDDLLLQIFTCTVLQREAGQEAPFLEFIQRVCSEKVDSTGKPRAMKPGCGGFGIRNFLTLFLSIEVSKASKGKVDSEAAGKTEAARYYQSMVDAFTSQLDESNPVLTGISDAMTAEGEALERGDKAGVQKWAEAKSNGQQELMRISSKYRDLMRKLREAAPAGC